MTGDVRGQVRVPRPPPDTESAAPATARPRAELPDPTPVRFLYYLDDECSHWSVVEVDARAVPGARGVRCLIFMCESCIRRVWDYPPDWRTYDDAGLAALSWRR